MKNVKLKRCPVPSCGGEPRLHPDLYLGTPPNENTAWRVTCRDCGFGTTMGTEAYVIKIWNET